MIFIWSFRHNNEKQMYINKIIKITQAGTA